MKLRILLWTFLGISIIGCSTDENINVIPEQVQKASFKVVGEDASVVYLYSFDGAEQTSSTDNLTEEIGILPDYLTLRQLDGLLSFYTFFQGSFSLKQKDINTGASSSFDEFYANGPDRSVAWGTNTTNSVYFGYFTSGNSRNLAIQNVALSSTDSEDFIIDFNVNRLFQPIQYDEKLFLTYLDNQGNYKLTFFDTALKIQGPIVNFSAIPISILIDEFGDLAVVKNGVDATLESYSSTSLSFLNTTPLNFNSALDAGPVNGAVIANDKFYYARPFVQPAEFSAGPAVFNLNSQESMPIDLPAIVNQVEEELDAPIGITTQRFSKLNNVFLVAYAVLSNEVKGGVMQIAPDGRLIANDTFPFQPTYILED